ncbi:MAG: hypothetical protein IJX99_06460 [Clostridia bacterium]|nr:hypothetical protein [Clostridia bacterium]
MLGICLIFIFVCLVIIAVFRDREDELETSYQKRKKDLESMWKTRVDNVKNELSDVQKQKSELRVENIELTKSNNQLKEENLNLKNELEKIYQLAKTVNDKREKARKIKKMLPKKPKTNDRNVLEQYVKEYLDVLGIEYKLKNKTNSLLSVYEGKYEIYCGTELYINKATKEKKHGLKMMVQEIKKLDRKKEKNKNEKK